MHVIHNWLTEHPLNSCENLLARVILSGLNWGTKSEVCEHIYVHCVCKIHDIVHVHVHVSIMKFLSYCNLRVLLY